MSIKKQHYFIQKICTVKCPEDALWKFQKVFIGDLSRMILKHGNRKPNGSQLEELFRNFK